MNPRASILIIACLMLHGMSFPEACMAEDAARTIKLDGKTLYIPEVKLTRKINPITNFLYVGSWAGGFRTNKAQKSLCAIRPENNEILILSPEKLLENSRTGIVAQSDINALLDGITWETRQATHIAFKAISGRRLPAVVELYAGVGAVLFHNGKLAGEVTVANSRAAGGRGYLPVMLEEGENIINIMQFSIRGKPIIQVTVSLDHAHDLTAARQQQGGLLKKLIHVSSERADIPALDWSPSMGNFSVTLDVRDVSTNNIILHRDFARRGRLFDNEESKLSPGIYEVVYRTQNESASELFIVGNPHNLFAGLQERLSHYNPDPESKLDIEAQLRRARILLSKENYDVLDRQFQEKLACTFGALTTMERRLKEGVLNIAKDQPGLHIRGFSSESDDSFQAYRLYVPSNYNPSTPLPLLVIPSTQVRNSRPFIEGPVIANHREALLWARYAEQYGFALLWPGYRGSPNGGYTCESVRINEAIKAVEKDYNIENISLYATCGAGFNAGRLVSEYPNRFAAIVYDRAVFDLALPGGNPSPSLLEWLKAINPSNHVLDDRNLRIFVMNDDTKPAGHGPMELTTKFLDQARQAERDVTSYLSEQPMTGAERMDMVFSWVAPCRSENPGGARSHFVAKAGYTGPISEIFATPILVVEGTRASESDLMGIQIIVESLRKDYMKYFHDAECVVKKDTDVTQHDIETHSLVLIGNPQSNSIWEKLQPRLAVKVTASMVLHGNDRLAGAQPFQAIVRNPDADDKYVLMIGAWDLRNLWRITTGNLFTAWYDCMVFDTPNKIISKLDGALRANDK